MVVVSRWNANFASDMYSIFGEDEAIVMTASGGMHGLSNVLQGAR
jgi:hypothetical protein